MNYFKLIAVVILATLLSCKDTTQDVIDSDIPPTASAVIPIDIDTDGFDFLANMQGHWVGHNLVMNNDYSWFGWDFRAISSSHVHGIFQGGTMGDLFVSFFITNYKNTRTIMARNGGVLNGIYRTTYFVLDKVEDKGEQGKYYRFVDAIGGAKTTSFEIRFKEDNIFFNVYTSGLGTREPTRHMTFVAKKKHMTLAQKAAQATNFPQNIIDRDLDFTNGFKTEYLYVEKSGDIPKSATFMALGDSNDVYALASQSGDPYTILDHPRLGTLQVDLTRDDEIKDDKLLLYLSKDALTDSHGMLISKIDTYDTILQFPELSNKENNFLFTYVHPGDYYLTVVADKNGDGSPSQGDVLSISQKISIAPLEKKLVFVTNIDIQN